MEELIKEFINIRDWAVVGATENPEKYGNKVLRDIINAGYRAHGINPKGGQVGGKDLLKSLSELPSPPLVIDIVVPPKVTEQVVKEAHELGYERIWMQPGAESEEAIKWAEEHGMKVVHDTCIMIRKRDWPEDEA